MARAPKFRFFYGCSLDGLTFDRLLEVLPDNWRSGGSEEGWERWINLYANQSLEVTYQTDRTISRIYWGR